MNKMVKQASFSEQFACARYGSRFETPDMSRSASPCAQFGSRLRKVFELPCAENQPEQFVILLRQIAEKLGEKH